MTRCDRIASCLCILGSWGLFAFAPSFPMGCQAMTVTILCLHGWALRVLLDLERQRRP